MAKKSTDLVTTRFKARLPTFIRAWRKFRGLTLERLAERVEMTAGNLSQIERGETAYTQNTLEALAEALRCAPADLLMRDPRISDSPWSIWEALKPEKRRQAIKLLKALAEDDEEAA